MNTVGEGLEDFANVKMDTTVQHVDASDFRIKRDIKDIKKLFEWFSLHDSFPEVKKIISIASGVDGVKTINCHNAREVGIASMNKIIGQTFNNIKLKRADKVLSLLTLSSTIKFHDEKVPIDPILLFQRMSITKTFGDELEQFFEYELAPYSLPLFDSIGMHKTQKPAIYDFFFNVLILILITQILLISLTEDIFYIVSYGIEKKHLMLFLRNTFITYIDILVITLL